MQRKQLSQERLEDKRRTLRMSRASLTSLKMDDLDRPSLKIAETTDEYSQSFALVRAEYMRSGYLPKDHAIPFHFSVHSLLPESRIFIFKNYLKVIATLTEIPDSKLFGLPMDSLYKEELDSLRAKGFHLAELSAFSTSSEFRMRNIMTYLCKAMFIHSKMVGIDYLCIMVNPKHVSFYRRMFLFEVFGPEKYYENVKAPAVPMILNLQTIEEQLESKYSGFKFEEDLHHFFCRTTATRDKVFDELLNENAGNSKQIARYFLQYKPQLLKELSNEQTRYIMDEKICPVYIN